MEDMERYGDYNDTDDEEKAKPNLVGIIIKILAAVVIIAVLGILVFRIIIFNNYPASMSTLYVTDSLAALGDNLSPMTQTNGIKYDDAKDGNFFFDHLVVVPEANHLQVTVRYNTSLITNINTKFGKELSLDADPTEIFNFAITRTATGYVAEEGETNFPTESAGDLVYVKTDSSFMYKYTRLAFDNCDLGLDDGEKKVGWVRLEITVKALEGVKDAPTYYINVYVGDYGLIEIDPATAPAN